MGTIRDVRISSPPLLPKGQTLPKSEAKMVASRQRATRRRKVCEAQV